MAQVKDNLLQEVLEKIEKKSEYTLIGCSADKEFPGEALPFVKKAGVDFGDITIFLMSYPFLNDKLLVCQEVVICRKTIGEPKVFVSKNEELNSFFKQLPLKEFRDKNGEKIICGILD